jgi:hypothetical protein
MRFHVICAAIAISALAAIRMSNAGEAGCSAAASDGCCDSCGCCPKCGCHEGMIPVCHNYCEMKKTTKYHYCCKCEEICAPSGHSKCCGGCDKCGGEGNGGCGCNEGCGGEEENCHCHIYTAHKLVKIPYTVETPVKKCKVEWVCPRCGCNCGTTEAPNAAPAPSGPPTPAPGIPTPPPPAPKSAQHNAANPISQWTAAILGNHSDERSAK